MPFSIAIMYGERREPLQLISSATGSATRRGSVPLIGLETRRSTRQTSYHSRSAASKQGPCRCEDVVCDLNGLYCGSLECPFNLRVPSDTALLYAVVPNARIPACLPCWPHGEGRASATSAFGWIELQLACERCTRDNYTLVYACALKFAPCCRFLLINRKPH